MVPELGLERQNCLVEGGNYCQQRCGVGGRQDTFRGGETAEAKQRPQPLDLREVISGFAAGTNSQKLGPCISLGFL